MNFSEVPIPMLRQQLIHPDRQGMVGKRFRVVHLKSPRGQTLNGQTVTVGNFDRTTNEAHLHCTLDESGEKIKLKNSNLLPLVAYDMLENFMAQSLPIPQDKLAACISKAVRRMLEENSDRADMLHRIELYKKLLEKIENSGEKKLEDDDFRFPCGAGCELLGDNFGLIMNQCKPACYGDEVVDIRHMDIGLTGDNHCECSVCSEALQCDPGGDTKLVTLPCLHVFHEACIVQWLDSDLGRIHWNCPTCRAVVPFDMSTYRVNYMEQLQRRVDEFIVSGFCAKCQIMIMENRRNEPLGFENEDGNVQIGPVELDPDHMIHGNR